MYLSVGSTSASACPASASTETGPGSESSDVSRTMGTGLPTVRLELGSGARAEGSGRAVKYTTTLGDSMLPGIGIFGVDPISYLLAPFLRGKGFRVEAIWALTSSDAQLFAKDLSIPFWTNKVDEVLLRKDVELVLILCPPNLHSQIAVKALGIGKHVLCDRPAGLSQCESLKMVLAAQYYPSLICVLSHGLRFHPAFIQMRKFVDRYVGKPSLCQCRIDMGPTLATSFNWLCDDVMGGGIVTLFGSHIIDLVTYLTGQKAVRVHGVTKTFITTTATINGTRRITSPDFAMIQMEMSSGMFVTISLTNHMPRGYFNQEITLYGSKGILKAECETIKGMMYNNESLQCTATSPTQNGKEQPQSESPQPPQNPAELQILYEDSQDSDFLLIDKSIRNDEVNKSSVLPPIYLDGLLKLIGCLREAFNIPNGKEWKKESVVGLLGAGFEEGLYVQAVIDAIKRSAKENQWVKVEIMTEEPDPNPVLTAQLCQSN